MVGPMSLARVTAIKTRIDTVSDADLPPPARRNRAVPLIDSNGTAMAIGDTVTFPEGTGTVLGHGRGAAWIIVAWDEDGNDSYGTWHKRFVDKV